jgi:hypothetical protein
VLDDGADDDVVIGYAVGAGAGGHVTDVFVSGEPASRCANTGEGADEGMGRLA